MSIREKLIQAMMVAAVAAVLALGNEHLGWLESLEHITWDLRARRLADSTDSTEQIKLILIDQASLDWAAEENGLGWPWPREVFAAMIDFVAQAGARVIVVDLLFSEPSSHDVYQDQILGETIQSAGNVVQALTLSHSVGRHQEWPEALGDSLHIAGAVDLAVVASNRYASFPVEEVRDAAKQLGYATADPDAGAVIRRVPLFETFAGRPVPILGLAAWMAGHEHATLAVEPGRFHYGDATVPIDPSGRAILRYRVDDERSVGHHPYDAYSAAAVLQSHVRMEEGGAPVLDPAVFQDAYVFFGASAPGLLDLRPTPLMPVAPGVTIHATLLDNLLEAEVMSQMPAAAAAGLTLGLALLTAMAVRFTRKARHAALVLIVLSPLPLLAGVIAYTQGVWAPVAAPALAVALAAVATIVVNYAVEGRERAFIKDAFQHYLSPLVIDQILKDPSRLQLGGERRELSIFFSDLQGFSTIAEQMEAEELTALLNEYLTDMTNILLEEEGTLDKYEGDAIIAFWNAPLDQPDHAERACRAALRCQRRLAEKRNDFKAWSGHELWMRIGINTGAVAVGNMGSHDRFDYTVLGDAANLAARLEGANKAFGTFLMVSESTWAGAEGSFVGRPIGSLRVVGRDTPVRVYEPLAFAGEIHPAAGRLDEAMTAFEAGDLTRAEGLFSAVADDPLAQHYAARCRAESDAPASAWDPVWNLTSK
jgi:adenylate cyclase